MNTLGRSIFAAVLFAGALALNGCSDESGSSPTGTGGSGGTGTGSGSTGGGAAVTAPPPTLGSGCANQGTDVMCITLSSTAASVPADGTSTAALTAVLTRNNSPFPGAIVNFSLGATNLGALTAPAQVTNAAGVATTSFQAGANIGAIAITATHSTSSAASTVALSLTQAPGAAPAGIRFMSATPSNLQVAGSGGQTTANVVFRVTDSSGGAIPNAPVSFTMIGPVGSYVGSQVGSTTATGTTNASGDVTVPLNAGSASGPVTITASVTVGPTTFRTSSSVISIGGAVPSATHFTVAAERLNYPGLVLAGFTRSLRVFVADRFSNSSILATTQVSLFTEAGAVGPSISLDATGAGSVSFRTQDPMPSLNVPTLNQRGHLFAIAVVRGEEGFIDANGNGLYDLGETIVEDLGEPYIDANDNGVWDIGEFFVDANGNRQYDGPNGRWDGPGCPAPCDPSPMIWKSIKLQFTGHITCTVSYIGAPGPFSVPNGGSRVFRITVADQHNNVPVPGTNISVVTTRGTLGNATVTVPDVAGSMLPFTHDVELSDNDPAAPGGPATLTFTVTTPQGEGVNTCLPFSLSGTVN